MQHGKNESPRVSRIIVIPLIEEHYHSHSALSGSVARLARVITSINRT